MTSAAEGGTIFVLYPTAAAISTNYNVRRITSLLFKKKKKKNPPNKMLFSGIASIGILASDLNTKVSVTCPHISSGTTVTTVGHYMWLNYIQF